MTCEEETEQQHTTLSGGCSATLERSPTAHEQQNDAGMPDVSDECGSSCQPCQTTSSVADENGMQESTSHTSDDAETMSKGVESSVSGNTAHDDAVCADVSDAAAAAGEAGEVRRHARIYSGLNPRGLIDGLTRFFTPSDRRGPRVCRDSRSPASNSPNRIRRRRRRRESSESDPAPPRRDSVTSSSSVLGKYEADLPPASADSRLAAVPVSVPLTSASTSTSTSTSPRHRRRDSGVRRRREQLVDGLSHFFKAVGKRRSCIPLRLRHDGALRGAESEPENCDRVKATVSDSSVRSSISSKCLSSTNGGSVSLKRLSVDVVRASASSSGEGSRTAMESRNATGLAERSSDSSMELINCDSTSADVLPSVIMYQDLLIFKKAQKIAVERRAVCCGKDADSSGSVPRCIHFGPHQIYESVSSNFPEELAQLQSPYICNYCLKYVNNRDRLDRHSNGCSVRQPPGDEIYFCVNSGLSVYELDGSAEDSYSAVYCASLMLMFALFVDTDEASAFAKVPSSSRRFYVLTKHDQEDTNHFVGCFFKDVSPSYLPKPTGPLSGVFVLPPHRRKGYGDFLVRFSYLLHRSDENRARSSSLTVLSSSSYLQSCHARMVVDFMRNCPLNEHGVTVRDVVLATGLSLTDAVATLRSLGTVSSETVSVRESSVVDIDSIKAVVELGVHKEPLVKLDPACLRYTSGPRDSSEESCRQRNETVVVERDDVTREIRTTRPCFRGRPKKVRAATVLARRQDLTDVRNREPDAVRRRPPKRKTLRDLSTTRLKKFRFGPRHTANGTESVQHSDPSDSELVRLEKSPAVAEAASRSGDVVVCSTAATGEGDTAGVDVDAQQRDVCTTALEDSGNTSGLPSCDSVDVPSEEMSEKATRSALPASTVDQPTDDDKPVALKRIPTRVSVAVQTDAYESDEYSDDDSSSSSGSWDSCGRSDDESSDEEMQEETAKFDSIMSDKTRCKNKLEPDVAMTAICDDVSKADVDCDVDDSGCVAAESSSDFPDIYDNPLTTASPRSASKPLENESCDADVRADCSKEPVYLDDARSDDEESARVSAVDSPTSVETSSDEEESECESENKSPPAFAGQTERLPCSFGLSQQMSPLPPRAPSMDEAASADRCYGLPSLATGPAQCPTVGAAEVQGDFERTEKARVDDVLMFKTPEQSPVDNRFGQSSVTYQSSSSAVTGGGYGSSPTMYGALDGSPSCVVAAGNQSCLSINGNTVGYSLPTPSPTNSSSRSFSMASPSSAYQQPSSVGGTPTGFQFEPMAAMGTATGYVQEPARFQPAVPAGGGQGLIVPIQESYSPSAYHYGHPASPLSVDQPGRNCPSAPMLGYAPGSQRSQSYKVGMNSNGSFPYAAQWQQFGHQPQPSSYHHQQQQQLQQHSVGYFPQQAATDVIPHLAMDQRSVVQMSGQMSVAATGSRSSLNACEEKMMHRRCSKSCNKNCSAPAAYRGASGIADVAAPNVAIHPGTNVITGYGSTMYDQTFSAAPQRKSNSTVHVGSAGGVHPPHGYATGDSRHSGMATIGYQREYVGERYHQDIFATHAARTQTPDGAYAHHQRMSSNACLTPVHGSGRVQGAVYPNMAAAYDPYVNSMTSFGMRWQNS